MKKLIVINLAYLLILIYTLPLFAQWTQQTSGTTEILCGVYFVDQNIGWVVGNNGTILHTINGGINWTGQTSPDSASLNEVFFSGSDTGWAVDSYGTIIKTSDGGLNWEIKQSGVSSTLMSIYFVNSDTGWAAGFNGVILISTDSGESWSQQISGTTEILEDVHFTDLAKGWIPMHDGNIIHTTNGGATWSVQMGNSTEHMYGNYFVNTSLGWTVGSNGTILKTTNGTSWIPQTSSISNSLFDVHFISDITGWAVGGPGRIINTTDGGSNWSIQNSTINTTLYDLFIADSCNGWAVGPGGVILNLSCDSTTTACDTCTISGYKWNDLDGDGVWDTSEPGLAGWQINATIGSNVYTDTTDSLGGYSITATSCDSFIITETLKTGWTQTFPPSPGNHYGVFIQGQCTIDSLNFGNQIDSTACDTCTISGYKWNDLDGDGVWDNNEPGLPGWQINAAIGSNVYTDTTDSLGRYSITATSCDSFFITETLQTGWTQTFPPSPGNHNGVFTQGQCTIDSLNFGNQIDSLSTNIYEEEIIPESYILYQNYPNPFNPETNITFELPVLTHVVLKIYDVHGREINTLVNNIKEPGVHVVKWNGTNYSGNQVSSGIYIYLIRTKTGFIKLRKMLFIK